MKICAVNRIDYDGTAYNPGEELDCRKAVAERLLESGLASLPQPKVAPESSVDPDAELIEQINAAVSTEVLAALVPDAPDNPAIADVFAARWAELESAEKE